MLAANTCIDLVNNKATNQITSEFKVVDIMEAQSIEEAYQELDPVRLQAVSAQKWDDHLRETWEAVDPDEIASIEKNLKVYHFKSLAISGGYFVASSFGHTVTALLRSAGVHNWLTLHYSNTFVGIGFIGLMDHLINVYNPRLRTPALLATAIVFTLYNAGFELGPVTKDWGDFIGGQVGLSLYLIANSYAEFKLMTEKEGVPSNLSILGRVKRILFPLRTSISVK